MRCHLCIERTTRDQELCSGGHPTKPESNQILLHLQQLVVVWSNVNEWPKENVVRLISRNFWIWIYLLYIFFLPLSNNYTPGIYAEGYIVFVFPFVRSYVRSFIRSFVRTSVPFMELLQSFTLKQLEWSISQQPLIKKHSYLDHRYPGGSAFIPWLLTPGSMPRGGARGQKLGHL